VAIKPVKGSSNVAAVGYHKPTGALHVVFHSGGHYVYQHVTQSLFDRFMKADSKGNFLHKHIKNRHRFLKVL